MIIDTAAAQPAVQVVYPLLRFVESRNPAAEVRYDLHPGGNKRVLSAGFTLSAPKKLGDPGAIGAEWDYRRLTLTQMIEGTKATVQPQVTALAKEVIRPRNWLMYQPSPVSAPVWFRTYATQPGDMSFDNVYGDDTSRDIVQVQVDLDADPWAMGARIDLPPFTILNDPANPTAPIPSPAISGEGFSTGGYLPAATYYYVVTAVTTAGETPASNRIPVTVAGSTSKVAVYWYLVPGARAYRIWRGTTTGTQNLLGSVGAVNYFVDTGQLTLSPDVPPTANSTAGLPATAVLPAIKGDAPTPLIVTVTPAAQDFGNGGRGWDGYQPVLNVTPMDPGSAYSGPIVWPATAFAQDLDAAPSMGAVAPNCFGGSYTEINFATTTDMYSRLYGAAPVTPPIGRYRAYARVGRSDLASTFKFTLVQQRHETPSPADTLHAEYSSLTRGPSPRSNFFTYVDMGDFTFPLGVDLDAVNPGIAASPPAIVFGAQRLSGTGSLFVNGFVLIPVNLAGIDADASTLTSTFFNGLSSIRSGVWDGETERFQALDYGTNAAQGVTPVNAGGYPTAAPGARNVLHLLQQTLAATPGATGFDNDDQITAWTVVKVSYYPRFVWFADS